LGAAFPAAVGDGHLGAGVECAVDLRKAVAGTSPSAVKVTRSKNAAWNPSLAKAEREAAEHPPEKEV
jgi:hypothetical protein